MFRTLGLPAERLTWSLALRAEDFRTTIWSKAVGHHEPERVRAGINEEKRVVPTNKWTWDHQELPTSLAEHV